MIQDIDKLPRVTRRYCTVDNKRVLIKFVRRSKFCEWFNVSVHVIGNTVLVRSGSITKKAYDMAMKELYRQEKRGMWQHQIHFLTKKYHGNM